MHEAASNVSPPYRSFMEVYIIASIDLKPELHSSITMEWLNAV
jgi:hypothetical protein